MSGEEIKYNLKTISEKINPNQTILLTLKQLGKKAPIISSPQKSEEPGEISLPKMFMISEKD